MCSILYTSSENYEDDLHYNVIKDETDHWCIICWLPSQENSIILKMKDYHNINTICDCNPTFHYSCLKEWIDKTSSCPICRKKITINKPYVTPLTYLMCYVNLCFTIFHIATIMLLVNVLLLYAYTCYISYYITPKYVI